MWFVSVPERRFVLREAVHCGRVEAEEQHQGIQKVFSEHGQRPCEMGLSLSIGSIGRPRDRSSSVVE